MADTLHGFNRDDLEAIADGLDGYEKTVNVGNTTGDGDEHIESTTAAAARFIRAALANGVDVPPGASPDYTDQPWQDKLLARAVAAGFKRDSWGDWIAPSTGFDTTELLSLLSGLPLPERYTRGVKEADRG